jgi:acyl-CoA thioesterase-1
VVQRLLDKVADDRQLLQEDGIHPTAEGQLQIMRNVWTGLEPLLRHRS